mmetsp:Transcript_116062/g.281602  ORF Transcript_116062/g.281602 Transcript_116062/m.281602 type:complete len:141 (-) Transcript_116062:80-502(-)
MPPGEKAIEPPRGTLMLDSDPPDASDDVGEGAGIDPAPASRGATMEEGALVAAAPPAFQPGEAGMDVLAAENAELKGGPSPIDFGEGLGEPRGDPRGEPRGDPRGERMFRSSPPGVLSTRRGSNLSATRCHGIGCETNAA